MAPVGNSTRQNLDNNNQILPCFIRVPSHPNKVGYPESLLMETCRGMQNFGVAVTLCSVAYFYSANMPPPPPAYYMAEV